MDKGDNRHQAGGGTSQQKRYDEYTVEADDTLLHWMLATLGESRTRVKATLGGRGVRVGGKVVTRFDHPLKAGTHVSISRSKHNDTFRNRYVKVVYEDQWLVVVEKQVGVLSMAAGHSSLNVKTILDDYFHQSRQKCRAHVVHRLDRDTSGLMIYAKDMRTEQMLEQSWHETVYDRRYVAVLSGEMPDDEGSMTSWLKENNAYNVYSSLTPGDGKLAVTHFHVLRRTTEHSLVEFRLETGRKNQIRVHAADMGHPVCGDTKYGNGDNPLPRLCLHAYMLCFRHPVTHQPMEFQTPIPSNFLGLFK